jgi:hypothetical protein
MARSLPLKKYGTSACPAGQLKKTTSTCIKTEGFKPFANFSGRTTDYCVVTAVEVDPRTKLIDQLLSFSREQKLESRSLDLNETVVGMRDLLRSTMGGSIHIVTQLRREL